MLTPNACACSVAKDGTAPAILYGYGGFDVSMTPFFSPALLTWIKHYKGVLAVANIRGGSEYGDKWHKAGTKERKQNGALCLLDLVWRS